MPEGQTGARENSRWNALRHGLYAGSLEASAAALGEDLAEFNALREKLRNNYAPEDAVEERMIERMVRLMWRQERLTAYAERTLAADLAGGRDALEPLLAAEEVTPAELRLDRAIYRLHRDLLFLHRYRDRIRQEDARRRASRTVAERIAALELAAQELAPGWADEDEGVAPATDLGPIAAREAQADLHTEDPHSTESPEEPVIPVEGHIETGDWLKNLETNPIGQKGGNGIAHTVPDRLRT